MAFARENRREGKTQKEELQGIVIVVIAVEEQNIQVLHTTYIYICMYFCIVLSAVSASRVTYFVIGS